MNSDEKEMKILADALRKGWKMLSEHCERCGYPLFLVNNKKICLICTQERNKTEGDLFEVEIKKYLKMLVEEENIDKKLKIIELLKELVFLKKIIKNEKG